MVRKKENKDNKLQDEYKRGFLENLSDKPKDDSYDYIAEYGYRSVEREKRKKGKLHITPVEENLIIKEPEENICLYCGNVLEDDALFCRLCGKATKKSRNVPVSVKREVFERDNGQCVECGSTEYLEYDHIIPFSKGGSNTVRNIQILCEKCNRSKYDKI